MHISDNNHIGHLTYMKWTWISEELEWEIGSPIPASRSMKTWWDACKDVSPLDVKESENI
jgi:hypothetical protein